MKKIMFNDRYCLTEAVLDGRKTMTRKIIIMPYLYTIQHVKTDNGIVYYFQNPNFHKHGMLGGKVVYGFEELVIPKYKIGEVVAVAQSYMDIVAENRIEVPMTNAGWYNKMFVKSELMPHHIRITNIRVERLQDISDEDCLCEGIYEDKVFERYADKALYETPQDAFATLIDKVSGAGTWKSNPYVFIYEFELVD